MVFYIDYVILQSYFIFFDFARILNNLLRCYLKVAGKYTNRSIVWILYGIVWVGLSLKNQNEEINSKNWYVIGGDSLSYNVVVWKI